MSSKRQPEQIQSLAITGHWLRNNPSPHYVFTVQLTATPASKTWSIARRYSDFVRLRDALEAEIGSPPPGQLPRKLAKWGLAVFGARPDLTPEQLEDRRAGLERWLRTLVVSRDTRWARSRAFTAFIAADDGQREPSNGESDPDGRDLTVTTWLDDFNDVREVASGARTLMHERDELQRRNDAAHHAKTRDARRQLVRVVARAKRLTLALDRLTQEGLPEDEVRERRRMLSTLQDDVEGLGRDAQGGAQGARNHDRASVSDSGARRELLAGAPITARGGSGIQRGRALGAAAKSKPPEETAETRALDNEGVLGLQQTYMQEQDTKLEELAAILRRQRELAQEINREIREQDEILDEVEGGVDNSSRKLKRAQKQLERV